MKRSVLLLIIKVLGALSTIITGILISRVFGEEYFAEYSLLLTLISIGVLLSNWGSSNYIVQHFKSKCIGFDKIIYINIVFALMYISIIYFLKDWLDIESFFIAIFSVLFFSFFLTKSSYLIMNENQVRNSIVDDFLKNFLLAAVIYASYIYSYKDINEIYIIYFSLLATISVFLFRGLEEYRKDSCETKQLSSFFVQGFFVTISLLIILLLAQIDRFIINYYLDKEVLARYFLSYTLVALISLFSQSLIVLYIPKISKSIKSKDNPSLQSISKIYSKLIIMFILLQIIFYNITLKYIFQLYKINLHIEDYIVINLLLLGLLISNAFGIGVTIASYSNDKKVLVNNQLRVFLLYLPIVVIMIKLYGIVGAALSYCIGQIAIKFLMYRFYKKEYNLNLFFLGKESYEKYSVDNAK